MGTIGTVISRFSLVVTLIIVLIGCSSQNNSQQANFQKPEISMALAQALALRAQLAAGLSISAASDLKSASEIVYDFDGEPFYYLNILGKDTTNFWDTTSSVKSEQKFTVTATGASYTRNLYAFSFGTDYLEKLGNIRRASVSYKRLVSPGGTAILLEDNQGHFWNLDTGKRVDDQQVQIMRSRYADLKANFIKNNMIEGTKPAWDELIRRANGQPHLAPSPASAYLAQSVPLPTLDELTKPDGNFDIAKFSQSVIEQSQKKGVSYQYDPATEVGQCWGWFCYGMTYWNEVSQVNSQGVRPRTIANQNNYTGPATAYSDLWGNQQYLLSWPYTAYGLSANYYSQTSAFWGTWRGGYTTPTPVEIRWNGCGAQAFTRLMTWYGYYRNPITQKSNIIIPGVSAIPASIAVELNQPRKLANVNLNGSYRDMYQSTISDYMSGREFMGGMLIAPWYMVTGANRWLTEKNVSWELKGPAAWFQPGGDILSGLMQSVLWPAGLVLATSSDFNWWTWQVTDVVRRKIGSDNEPIIALWPESNSTNGLGAHFNLSFAYMAVTNPFYVDVYIWASSSKEGFVGAPNGWVNITNRWAAYGGAWGLYAK